MKKLLAIIILAGFAPAAIAQSPDSANPKSRIQNSKSTIPPVPREVAQAERSALVQCGMLVSKGQFEQAAERIRPMVVPGVVTVYVDWVPVQGPLYPSYLRAAQKAVHLWNAAMAGTVKFQVTEKGDTADLQILFEKWVTQVRNGQAIIESADSVVDLPPALPGATPTPGTAMVSNPPTPHPIIASSPDPHSRRIGRARIALNVPYTEEPQSEASMARLMARALGAYLGLAATTARTDVMGPDDRGAEPICRPTAREVQAAREAQAARETILAFAEKRVAAYLPRPVLSIEKPDSEPVKVQRGDSAHFAFQIKNTGDAPLEIDAQPTCACTVANFDKVIAPGKTGKVEADFHSAGYRGRVMKLIEVKSNDPEMPMTSLRLNAEVVSLLTVLPAETAIIPVRESEPTVKEFEIRTSGTEPIEVTKVACGVPYATAKLDALPAPAEGGKAYKVTLTIGQNAPVGRSAFVVTAFTTSTKEPQLNLTAICDKGILAIPSSLFMGSIGPNTVLPLTQIITLMKSDGDMRVTKASSEDPKLQVDLETIKEGAQYRVKVTYKGGWAAGAVRSKVVVETTDPHQPRVEIPVMAAVQAGGR